MSTREKVKRGNDLRVTTRRTNHDKINAKIYALLATASAPRQDKRENARFACPGGCTATRKTRKGTHGLPGQANGHEINAKLHTIRAAEIEAAAERSDKYI